MKWLRVSLGLDRTDEDMRLISLLKDTWRSVRVVGRGTVCIDPNEVRKSDEFRAAQQMAARMVQSKTAEERSSEK